MIRAVPATGRVRVYGVFRRIHGHDLSTTRTRKATDPTNSPSGTSCAASGRRWARRCSTCSATCASRPPTSTRSRTREPRPSPTRASFRATCAPMRATSASTPRRSITASAARAASPAARPAHGPGQQRRRAAGAKPRRGRLPARLPAGAAAAARGCAAVPLPAIGSLLVLVALVAGLGYGGWTVLQNIQRVQFAPVDDLPLAVAEVDALDAARGAGDRRAGADRPREPGGGDRAGRSLPPAGARGADPGAARRADRGDRPREDRAAGRAAPRRDRAGVGPEAPRRRVAGGEARRPCRPTPSRRRPPGAAAAGGGRRARGLDPGLSRQRHHHLRAHPGEGRDLFAARGRRRAADLGRQLRLGLRAGRRRRCTARSAAAPAPCATWCSTPKAIAERFAVVADVPEVISQTIGVRAGGRRPRSRSSHRARAGRGDIPAGAGLCSRRDTAAAEARAHVAQPDPPLAQHLPAQVAADPCRRRCRSAATRRSACRR